MEPATEAYWRLKAPAAYKTFSEIYSYCPPIPDDIRISLESKDIMFLGMQLMDSFNILIRFACNNWIRLPIINILRENDMPIRRLTS